MSHRGIFVTTALCAALIGSLFMTACGSRADDTESSTSKSSASSTASTAASSSTTAKPATTTTTMSDETARELAVFCTNAKPLGFTDLSQLQPTTVSEAVELRAKLDLIQATAPDDIAPQIVIVRATTDNYLDAVEDGRITDNDTTISWAGTFDVPTIDATITAVPVVGAYIADHC